MLIFVIDDHSLFLQGLETLLSRKMKGIKIQVFQTISELLPEARMHNPDLILADIHMPLYEGSCVVEYFLAQKLKIPVLLISATDDLRLIKRYLDLGAVGFVHKSSDSEELIAAIQAIFEQGFYLNQSLKERIINLEEFSELSLSPRQKDVLLLLAEGISNKQIGERLGIKETTIKSHISALFDTFEANNRLDCVRKAEALGLVDTKNESL